MSRICKQKEICESETVASLLAIVATRDMMQFEPRWRVRVGRVSFPGLVEKDAESSVAEF